MMINKKEYKLVLLRPKTQFSGLKGPEGFIENNNGIIAHFKFLVTEDGFIHTPRVEWISKKIINKNYCEIVELLFEFASENNENL